MTDSHQVDTPRPALPSAQTGETAQEAEAHSPATTTTTDSRSRDRDHTDFATDPWEYCFGRKPARPTPTTAPESKPESEALSSMQLFKLICDSIRTWTDAPEDLCETLSFWVLSTWFQDVFPVIPSLVIAGLPHHGMQILRVLDSLCGSPVLMPGFSAKAIEAHGRSFTLLISEPNLNCRMAADLGSMTCAGFQSSHSIAVYVGERSPVGLIPYSVCVAIAPNTRVLAPARNAVSEADVLRQHFSRYRKTHKAEVSRRMYQPAGLSPEVAEIARSLGSCIVNDPDLQAKMLMLLTGEDEKQRSHRSDSEEALILEALRNLSRKANPGYLLARDISREANRLLDFRGEKLRLTPEKVGHRLRKVGLPTRRLTKDGNGLVLSGATLARIEEMATMYVVEDLLPAMEARISPQAMESKALVEVM
jgi:hypothetical protein